ncbi:hypothetical protein [Halobacterium zhouii]|uniref:hypothetical protein n=1 Tax=Halobacterium zhouii TaxID=2902624 RepID=UPI001E319EEF|nr:hypothetical protein [Halobacterium zhouii]
MTDDAETPAVDAVERAKDAHTHLLGLATAAARRDAQAVQEHADALRDAADDVQALVQDDADAEGSA